MTQAQAVNRAWEEKEAITMRVFRPSSTTALRNNAVHYVPVWEGRLRNELLRLSGCRVPAAFQRLESHIQLLSLTWKQSEKKIALISFLTAAEWALWSRGCLKWSVAVMRGSLLLLLNERGCFWWLTRHVGSLLFWNDRKGALKVLRASLFLTPPPPLLCESQSRPAWVFFAQRFFQHTQMWLFSGYNLRTTWKRFSEMHKQKSGS